MKRKNCFELFGLDFMIDTDMNVWLIEVNTNPCLEESSKILEILIPRMLDDLFKLTIDKVF
jgi:D-alanine-D-alanine ligase-like ATP-grasp enzyme